MRIIVNPEPEVEAKNIITGQTPLESFKAWCSENQDWITRHLNQWYMSQGGAEWGRKQRADIGSYIDAHPDKYAKYVQKPEKWRDFLSGWFRRQRRFQNAQVTEYDVERKVVEAARGSSSRPTAISDILKGATDVSKSK